MKASENPNEELTVIPFGIRELDEITGVGGIPTRKQTEIFGNWSVGKSTLGLYLVRSAQEMGMDVCWGDSEMSWSNKYAKKLGVDPAKVELFQEEFAEKLLDEMMEWVCGTEKKKGHPNSLVILDSVGHLTPRDEMEKGAEGRTVGAQARLMASFVRRMKVWTNKYNVAMVFLNHEYDPISFGSTPYNAAFPNSQPSGGKKLEFAKDLSIHLSKTFPKSDEGKVLNIMRPEGTRGGDFIKARIFKSKIGANRALEAVFALTYGEGVKKDWNLLETALLKGIITRQGNTYLLGQNKIAVGKKNLAEMFKDESFAATIKTAINDLTNPIQH